MISLININKTYNKKKENSVHALKNVSIKFPDKGMVFLMGKSGSGKSTLLNVIGGLDSYDSGEIIINNVSTKDFNQSYFDSYRNTYVGFVFQEYNLLNEFSVKENVALAIQLQNKKVDDAKVNEILRNLDLDGYGNRKINELSGGQKQRVTIARALVKNPEIILADEPTGALDSTTGKQILDILKELSKEKLVVIVTHDEGFAKEYGDRIIELKDGEVVSDTSSSSKSTGSDFEDLVKKYNLSAEDAKKFKSQLKEDTTTNKSFKQTNNDDIKVDTSKKFELIKSKLPTASSFKIALSSLGHKKFKLIITVLLSAIAFTMFGFIDSAINYKHAKVAYNSFVDSDVKYITVDKGIQNNKINSWNIYFTDEEVKEMSDKYSIDFLPIINADDTLRSDAWTSISGVASLDNNDLNNLGYSMKIGTLPVNDNEIALTDYFYYVIQNYGFYYYDEVNYTDIQTFNPEEAIGKTMDLNEKEYIITGFVDTGFYQNDYDNTLDSASDIQEHILYANIEYSLYSKVFVSKNEFKELSKTLTTFESYFIFYNDEEKFTIDKARRAKDLDMDNVIFVNGERDTLTGNEVIVSTSLYYMLDLNEYDNKTIRLVDDAAVYWPEDYEDRDYIDLEFEVVGYYKPVKENYISVRNDWNWIAYSDEMMNTMFVEGSYGNYITLFTSVPEDEEVLKNLFDNIYEINDGVKHSVLNYANNQVDSVKNTVTVLRTYLVYVGIVLALFSMVLFGNYLSTSISYKKKDIGILRAIGSRGADVFKIFFIESLMIAAINFVLSCVGTFAVITMFNNITRNNLDLLITFLSFGIKQILLLLIFCVMAAFVASYLPISAISRKKPVETIRENS